MKILESRLTLDNSTITPPAYRVDPEWTDTEFDDLRDWREAAADNCPDIEPCPDAECPTVYGLNGAAVYRWPDAEGGWNYTAIATEGE
jgi:hypothetical protein